MRGTSMSSDGPSAYTARGSRIEPRDEPPWHADRSRDIRTTPTGRPDHQFTIHARQTRQAALSAVTLPALEALEWPPRVQLSSNALRSWPPDTRGERRRHPLGAFAKAFSPESFGGTINYSRASLDRLHDDIVDRLETSTGRVGVRDQASNIGCSPSPDCHTEREIA